MATNYPTSLDSFTDIDCNTAMNESGKSGVDIISALQDALEAVEAKVGVDSSAVATSLDYILKNASSSDPGHVHTLSSGAIDVTASAAELNLLDGIAAINDEDDMASDSATALATQQSIKAYVDNNIPALGVDGWFTIAGLTAPTRAAANDPTYDMRFTNDIEDQLFEGMRIKWTQNALVRYGIILDVGAWSGTQMDVRILTRCDGSSGDYDLLDDGSFPVSNVQFSFADRPVGWLSDKHYWTVKVVSTTGYSSATTSTSYLNLSSGSFAIDIPWGTWDVGFQVQCRTNYSSSAQNVTQYVALTTSTGGSSPSDKTLEVSDYGDVTNQRAKVFTLTDRRISISTAAGVTYLVGYRNSASSNRTSVSIDSTFGFEHYLYATNVYA